MNPNNGPLLYSAEGAKHFDSNKPVPSHWVASVIRGAVCEEARLNAEIEHLREIIDQFCMDAEHHRYVHDVFFKNFSKEHSL